MENPVKTYSNEEITIIWKPGVCIHSTICWKKSDSLKEVFKPMEKPWIDPKGASTERIIAQIDRCPSGALSYYFNEPNKSIDPEQNKEETKIEITANGPLLIHGQISIRHHDGTEEKIPKAIGTKTTAFCRCGASMSKPFCDGTHRKNGFKG